MAGDPSFSPKEPAGRAKRPSGFETGKQIGGALSEVIKGLRRRKKKKKDAEAKAAAAKAAAEKKKKKTKKKRERVQERVRTFSPQ